MTRLLHPPIRITVVIDSQGRPSSFRWDGRRHEVAGICNGWRVDTNWWKRRISRAYYKVETTDGFLCDLSLDEPGGEWYLARIYD